MSKKYLYIVSFLFSISAIFAQETFVHSGAGVSITLPAGWFYETEGDNMVAYTDDESVAVSFTVLNASDIDAALAEVDNMLAADFDNITLGEAESTTVNGMNSVWLDGTADELEMAFELIETPKAKTYLFMTAWGSSSAIEKYSSDVQLIFGEIQPAN